MRRKISALSRELPGGFPRHGPRSVAGLGARGVAPAGAGLRAALVAATGLLAACGYFGGSSSAARPSAGPQALQPLDPTAKALAAMVDAVGPSRSQLPVELKFSIRKRPELGQDDEVDYALVPVTSGIETIHVVFGSLDGLKVTQTGPSLKAIRPASGTPIFGSVTVRPTKTGLFTLTAAVSVQSPNQSEVWPFRIPVIAGEGPTETAASQP